MTQHVYRVMNNPKLVHILKRLSDAFLDSKSEHVTVEGSKSLLPINASSLYDARIWDERAIERRGALLFEKALAIWPRPGN